MSKLVYGFSWEEEEFTFVYPESSGLVPTTWKVIM
jgi:hypothetical protein